MPEPIKVLSDFAIGESVFLNENGSPAEYLVVNQGVPSNSSLYDSSCDGVWLLRKDIHSEREWNDSNANLYSYSTINTFLNGDFLNSFTSEVRAAIKQVKIPYNASGAKVSTKVFLLGAVEIGNLPDGAGYMYAQDDGAKLEYFYEGLDTAQNARRKAKLDGASCIWWLRTVRPSGTTNGVYVRKDGYFHSVGVTEVHGIRPALILPSTALFDPDTLEFVGVK